MATSLRNSRKRTLVDMPNSLMIIIHCGFWLSYECIASCKLRSLYHMITKLPGMSKLETVDQFTYTNATLCREFVMSLSTVVKGKL